MSTEKFNLVDADLLKVKSFVNGGWTDAASGDTFPIINPSTGQLIASVPNFGAIDVSKAIAAAEVALPKWRGRTASERANILRRWSELILQHQQDLAVILTLEQGKPLVEARSEIVYAASFLEWFAEEARRVYGDVIPAPARDRRFLVLKQPIGVCAAITPWNFPAAMITRKVGPALAAGCTMVLKPAEQTPLSALALAELSVRAGVPAGVFNVITGDALVIGDELCANPTVRKLSFTGSTEVGRILMAQCAPTLKKLSLELGGNAPFIVFDDADIDAAVAGALASKYRNAGQTCICPNRFLIQAGIYNAFAEKLNAAVTALTVGDGFESGVTQGPLIGANALAKVESLITDAIAQGGKLISGGKRHSLGGNFFEPTIIRDVTPAMRLMREEIFGPVAPLLSFRDEAEAIHIANDTEYGLAAYFYTRDIDRVWRVGEALEYGMIGINSATISNEVAPFGGMKQSGLGREGSKYGIDEYLEIKYLCIGGL